MTLDQKQKQFWNRHAKRNKNPRDPNVSVVLGAFVSRSTKHVCRVLAPQNKVYDSSKRFTFFACVFSCGFANKC